jgi:hypothetical protein
LEKGREKKYVIKIYQPGICSETNGLRSRLTLNNNGGDN